jgi:hypothetical protein
VRGAKPGALVVGEVREASATIILKSAEGPVRPISVGRLGRKIRRKLQDPGEGGNEEVNQFRFHSVRIVNHGASKVARRFPKRSLVISFRQA